MLKNLRTEAQSSSGISMDVDVISSVRRSRRNRLEGTNYAEIDRHIGRRLRNLRLLSGYSQVKLAKFLGISFQQVQKYETGRDRVSVSTLLMASDFLRFSMADFFNFKSFPYDEKKDFNAVTKAAASLHMIKDKGIRKSIFALIQSLPMERAEDGFAGKASSET